MSGVNYVFHAAALKQVPHVSFSHGGNKDKCDWERKCPHWIAWRLIAWFASLQIRLFSL